MKNKKITDQLHKEAKEIYMPKKRNRRLGIFILIMGLALAIVGMCYKGIIPFNKENKQDVVESMGLSVDFTKTEQEYDVDEEIEEALKRLEVEKRKAKINEKANVSQRKISLVFTGLAFNEQMEQILQMLSEYNVKAMFLIDSMSAAEDPDTVKAIKKAGHEIGNYGFEGERYLQDYSAEEITRSFAYAQAILEQITGDKPQKFAGNAITYTDKVLHSAYCAGLNEAVKPSSFICEGSFKNFTAAMGYVEQLEPGEIVCVKLNDTLDDIEYEELETDERPAIDFEGSLEKHEEQKEEELDIVVTVEYFLESLRTTETAVVPLERLYIDWDKQLESIFSSVEDAAQYQVKESETVSPSYLKNTLFIGDSLTQTLALAQYPNGVADLSHVCAYKSITINQILNNVTAENAYGENVDVLGEILGQSPDKIYILLGANSFSIERDESILDAYRKLLELLKEKYPSVPIFIEGLPPVSKTVSMEKVTMTKGRILNYNIKLAKLAQEQNCYYIDLYTALGDEEGNLPYFMAQKDGIHLKEAGCKKWMSYILSHVPEALK